MLSFLYMQGLTCARKLTETISQPCDITAKSARPCLNTESNGREGLTMGVLTVSKPHKAESPEQSTSLSPVSHTTPRAGRLRVTFTTAEESELLCVGPCTSDAHRTPTHQI